MQKAKETTYKYVREGVYDVLYDGNFIGTVSRIRHELWIIGPVSTYWTELNPENRVAKGKSYYSRHEASMELQMAYKRRENEKLLRLQNLQNSEERTYIREQLAEAAYYAAFGVNPEEAEDRNIVNWKALGTHQTVWMNITDTILSLIRTLNKEQIKNLVSGVSEQESNP